MWAWISRCPHSYRVLWPSCHAAGETIEHFYAIDLPVSYFKFDALKVNSTATCRAEKPEMVLLGGLANPVICGKSPEQLEHVSCSLGVCLRLH